MNDDLDALAAQMIAPAARLVPAVQAGDAAQSQATLERLGVLELRALAVVLATWVTADHLALFASSVGDAP